MSEKKKALGSFFGKGKKKKPSKKEKTVEAEAVEDAWAATEVEKPTVSKVQVKATSSATADEVNIGAVLDEEEARSKFWAARQKAAQQTTTEEEPSTLGQGRSLRWTAVNVRNKMQFPTLSGEAKEGGEKKVSAWGAVAMAEVPEEETVVEKEALGEFVELVPSVDEFTSRDVLKKRAQEIIDDLRKSAETAQFVKSMCHLNPSEEFAIDELKAEAVYSGDDDYIPGPVLAIQRGRQVVIEKLLESACDWEETERAAVAPALVAVMTAADHQISISDEDGNIIEETIHGAALDRSAVANAVKEVLEFLDDIMMDAPQADKYFAQMLQPLVEVSDATTQKPCLPRDLLPLKVQVALGIDEETLERKRREKEEKEARRRELYASMPSKLASDTTNGRPTRPKGPGAALAALLSNAAADKKPLTPAQGGPLPSSQESSHESLESSRSTNAYRPPARRTDGGLSSTSRLSGLDRLRESNFPTERKPLKLESKKRTEATNTQSTTQSVTASKTKPATITQKSDHGTFEHKEQISFESMTPLQIASMVFKKCAVVGSPVPPQQKIDDTEGYLQQLYDSSRDIVRRKLLE